MVRMGIRLFCLFVILSIVTINIPSSWAQTQNTGAIQGRVFEAGTLAPLPGAAVTITHEDLGLERSTVTNADGVYYVGILPAGRYKITASRQGYETDVNPQNSMIRNFLIHITNTERADQPPPIILHKVSAQPTPAPPVTPPPVTPPPTQATVTTPPTDQVSLLVNVTNATRGGNFDELFLLSLPLPGVRSFDNLAFLVPGVAPAPLHIGTTVGPGIGPGVGTAGQFSVNGLRSRSNNFTIDGSDNNDEDVGVRRQGFTSLVPQSIESVQEFQISTLLPEPQYGRNMGAQVNAVSRSGGGGYHGTIYGFLTDSRLRARDPFEYQPADSRSVVTANGQTVLLDGSPLTVPDFKPRKNPYTRAQYGFVFGGPIASQKTHFFFSFERQDINASRTAHFAVPTVADRGLFGTGATGIRIPGAVGGTAINAFPTSLTGNAFISLFPFPNNAFGPYRTSTYTEVLPASADGNIFSVKLDHNLRAFGKDHTLTGRYNFTDDDTILPVTGEALFSSLRALVRTQNLALSLNTALSSRAANQFRFSFGRTNLGFEEVRSSFLLPSTALPNVPFLLNAPLRVNASFPGGPPVFLTFPGFDSEGGLGPIVGLNNTGTGPIGQVRVSGYSPVGVDVFNFPQGRTNNLFQFADTLIFNLRKHRFTAGFDIRRSHLNSFLDRNSRPLAVFSGAVDEFGKGLPIGQRLPELIGGSGAVCPPGAPCFYTGRDYLAAGAATGFFQSIANGADSNIRLRYWQYNFFLSDQIRISENFTLTVGARYELNTVPTEVDSLIESTFDSADVKRFAEVEKALSAASGLPAVSGFEQFIGGRKKIYGLDKNNVAPHIAFAWDPFGEGKTSIRAGYGIYFDQILGAVISQSRNVFPRFLTLNFGGFNQFADLNNPDTLLSPHPFIPVNPANIFVAPGTLNTYKGGDPVVDQLAASLLTNLASGPSFILPSNSLETPYAQHWGLTIEHAFKRDFLISAAYVGTKGVHLLRFATPNLGPNAIPVVQNVQVQNPIRDFPNLTFPVLNGISLPPNINGERLRPFPFLGSITSIESDANSTYHSLQLQAMKRFSRGIQFTTAYTWSHAIDEVSDIFDLAGATALPQNSFNRRAERGDANFDVRHRFVYSFIWNLPIFEESKIFGGWQFASIGTFQTGQPYSTLFCCDINLDGNLTDRVEPTISLPGNSPRNIYRAPGVYTVDVALNKYFRITERQSLEFRTEVFNLFNKDNFGIPVHQLFFGGYSTEPANRDNNLFVDTRVPNRTVQFALKYIF